VFVDPSGSESQSAEFDTNAWPDLGTHKTRIKENVPKTKKLNGTTIKQAGKSKRLASSGTSIIVPYVDPAPEDMPPPPVPAAKKVKTAMSTPAKASFTPFVDEGAKVPSTPTFTPFRDEVRILMPTMF
jgi:spindle assembly checkpoint component MAD3